MAEKGNVMAFLTLEDETGLVEAVAFPDTYRLGALLPIQGHSTRQDGLNALGIKY